MATMNSVDRQLSNYGRASKERGLEMLLSLSRMPECRVESTV